LLGLAQRTVVERSGLDPQSVGQVVAGCINQSGAQSTNIGRTAWLAAGLPVTVPATTIDSQCGSSQQAVGLTASLIASGVIDVGMACGVESMSTFAIGGSRRAGPGDPITPSYRERFEWINQFEAAERIADHWGISREECDQFGYQCQTRAQRAWTEGRFDREIIAVDAPVPDESGTAVGDTARRVDRDQGLRETSMAALSALTPVGRPDGVHTAGSSSQIADQASAVLLTGANYASEHGLSVRASIVDHCLVGSDPVMMLTGPIPATRLLLERNGLSVADIDVFEVNEAFAAVVLAWAREMKPDMERVNPNGGAIAIGHALGSTGTRLVTTAVNELERRGGEWALVTMCCGGGLGTGTLIHRA
jgi:acetyl-CoA C-acetyltransferase